MCQYLQYNQLKAQGKEKKTSLRLLRDVIFEGKQVDGVTLNFKQPDWFFEIRKEHKLHQQSKKKLTDEELSLLQEIPANQIPYDIYDILDAAIHDFTKALGINYEKKQKKLRHC